MGRAMGIPFNSGSFKKKNRWVFTIESLIDVENFSSPVLPPLTSARPSLTFKEIQIEHLIETISMPGKAEWGLLEMTLYDIQCNENPVFKYLKRLYDPSGGTYKTLVSSSASSSYKISSATLSMLNGCGETLESWVYEGLWLQKMDWGQLDMASGEVVTVDVAFRYDRAYQLISVDNTITGSDGGSSTGTTSGSTSSTTSTGTTSTLNSSSTGTLNSSGTGTLSSISN